MQEIIVSVTQRGQVTIPAIARRVLGAKPKSKVAFQIDGDSVRILPAKSTLESIYGSIPPLRHRGNLKALARKAKDEKAKRVIREI